MCTIVHNVFVSQMFLKDKSKLTDYKSKYVATYIVNLTRNDFVLRFIAFISVYFCKPIQGCAAKVC